MSSHTTQIIEHQGELWLPLPDECVAALGLTPPAEICWVLRDDTVCIVRPQDAQEHEILARGEIVVLQGET